MSLSGLSGLSGLSAIAGSGGGGPAPVNTVRPAITGTPEIGETLSVSTGTWANSPSSYQYEWRDENVAIGGATANTFTAIEGKLSCYVRAVNAAGTSAWVRATSGNPTKVVLGADSTGAFAWVTTDLQAALDAEFGAGTVDLENVSESGANMDRVTELVQLAYANLHKGSSFVVFYEYANDVLLLQGTHTAVENADRQYALSEDITAAGMFPLMCTSWYQDGGTFGFDGENAAASSDLIRANYAAHDAVGLVDLEIAAITSDTNANDGLHQTEAVSDEYCDAIVAGLVAAGCEGNLGDVIVAPAVLNTLKTFSNFYFYDPTNPLPFPLVASTITISGGTGWNTGTFNIQNAIESFPTDDGNQCLYYVDIPGGDASQTGHPLTGGIYELNA